MYELWWWVGFEHLMNSVSVYKLASELSEGLGDAAKDCFDYPRKCIEAFKRQP